MPTQAIIPVKFGGSILTDKAGDGGIQVPRLEGIAEAVAGMDEALLSRLVIILGGGSIGHRAAVRHGLAAGAARADGLFRMSREMFLLKGAMAEALERHGVVAFPFHEGSVLLTEGETLRFQGEAVRAAVRAGVVPILSGGPVLSPSGTMTAFNSDRLGHALLAEGGFTLERFILFSDVPGVLAQDGAPIPVLSEINRADVADIGLAAGVVDVSGGMMAKIGITLDLARRGIESVICGIDGLTPKRFGGIVSGTLQEGTRIVPLAYALGADNPAVAQ